MMPATNALADSRVAVRRATIAQFAHFLASIDPSTPTDLEQANLMAPHLRGRLGAERDTECVAALIRACAALPSVDTRTIDTVTVLFCRTADASTRRSLASTDTVLLSAVQFFRSFALRNSALFISHRLASPAAATIVSIIPNAADTFLPELLAPLCVSLLSQCASVHLRRSCLSFIASLPLCLDQSRAIDIVPSTKSSLASALNDIDADCRRIALSAFAAWSRLDYLALLIPYQHVVLLSFARLTDRDTSSRVAAVSALCALASCNNAATTQCGGEVPMSEQVFSRISVLHSDSSIELKQAMCRGMAELVSSKFSSSSSAQDIAVWTLLLLRLCTRNPLPALPIAEPSHLCMLDLAVAAEFDDFPTASRPDIAHCSPLHRIDGLGAGALLSAIEDEDPSVRAAAADAIGTFGVALVADYLSRLKTKLGDAFQPGLLHCANELGVQSGWLLVPCPGESVYSTMTAISNAINEQSAKSTTASASGSYRHYAGPAEPRQSKKRIMAVNMRARQLRSMCIRLDTGQADSEPVVELNAADQSEIVLGDDSADSMVDSMTELIDSAGIATTSSKKRMRSEIDESGVQSSILTNSTIPLPEPSSESASWLSAAHIVLPVLWRCAMLLWHDPDPIVRERAVSALQITGCAIRMDAKMINDDWAPLLLDKHTALCQISIRLSSQFVFTERAALVACASHLSRVISSLTESAEDRRLVFEAARQIGSRIALFLSSRSLVAAWHDLSRQVDTVGMSVVVGIFAAVDSALQHQLPEAFHTQRLRYDTVDHR